MQNTKRGAIFLTLFIISLLIYLSPYLFPSFFESIGKHSPIVFIYIIDTVRSIIILVIISSLFLANYFYSLERKRYIWLLTFLLLGALLAVIYWKCWRIPAAERPFAIYVINLLATYEHLLVSLIIVSGLITLFANQIKKVKYSFLGSLIIFILMILFLYLFAIFSGNRYLINEDKILAVYLYMLLLSLILLIILIPINIYLNKKRVEERRRKRILVLYPPLIIFAILAVIFAGLKFLLR